MGHIRLVVPFFLLGNAEVDERVVPEVAEAHRHGILDGYPPADLDAEAGHELEEPGQLLGREAGFRRLAGQVHLDERGNRELAGRALRAERVAELAELRHGRRLAALQVTDEVPPKHARKT